MIHFSFSSYKTSRTTYWMTHVFPICDYTATTQTRHAEACQIEAVHIMIHVNSVRNRSQNVIIYEVQMCLSAVRLVQDTQSHA